MSTKKLTREDVERILSEARGRGEEPDLRGADLSGANLHLANLYRADLSEANLFGAYLSGSDLRWADLCCANLSGSDLSGANLYKANLRRADLSGADLRWADLSGADLRGAVGVIALGDTPSGAAYMTPLPDGTWELTVGCWSGATTDLRELIAGDDWPEAEGDERDRRRPILTTLANLADVHAAYHHDWLEAVVAKWGDTKKETTNE